jgi:hypothetical protein
MYRDGRRIRSVILAVLITGAAGPVGIGRAAIMPVVQKIIPGWPGAAAQYLGRYHLTKSSDGALATGGELTVFLRKVPPLPKPVLSGILSLTAAHQSNVVYLTKFVHAGAPRWTTVNLGISTGPILGQFRVVSIHGGNLGAQLLQRDAKPVALEFVRFSSSPQP